MSTYAPTLYTGNQVDLDAIYGAIVNKIPVKEALNYIPGGVQSTASSASIASQSITVEADDFLEFMLTGNVSASATTLQFRLYSTIDGANQYFEEFKNLPVTSSSGDTEGFSIYTAAKNLSAGSHTVGAFLQVTGGVGTAYVGTLSIIAKLSKRRS